MKPFNLEEAVAGKPVVNRAGAPCIFTKYKLPTPAGYVGVSQNESGVCLARHRADGGAEYLGNFEAYDLFMASTTKTIWVNLFESPSFHYTKHPTESAADASARNLSCTGKVYPRVGNKAIAVVVEE